METQQISFTKLTVPSFTLGTVNQGCPGTVPGKQAVRPPAGFTSLHLLPDTLRQPILLCHGSPGGKCFPRFTFSSFFCPLQAIFSWTFFCSPLANLILTKPITSGLSQPSPGFSSLLSVSSLQRGAQLLHDLSTVNMLKIPILVPPLAFLDIPPFGWVTLEIPNPKDRECLAIAILPRRGPASLLMASSIQLLSFPLFCRHRLVQLLQNEPLPPGILQLHNFPPRSLLPS